MTDNLQERPAYCDTPGLSKTSALASQCKPDSMGQVKPDRPDIKSKALTDTDEKRKRLQKLNLTSRPSTETFQRFTKRIREANLNDYVKKYQMKMGNKTSTVDKDAWVDGIGGLSKRESKTLKRQLQGHTREGETSVRKFKKGQPNPQLDPPKGKKRWEEVNEDSRDKSKPDPKGRKHPEIKKDSEKAIGLLKKKGIPAKYASSQMFGDRIYVQRDNEVKAKKIIPKDLHQYVFGTIDNPVQAGFRTTEEVEIDEGLYSIKNTKTGQRYSVSKYQDDKKLDKIRSGGGDHKHAAHYKDGKMIDEYVGTIKKKRSEKEHGYPNQNPKKDKYTGYTDERVEGNKKTFAELSTEPGGILQRASSAAKKDAATQRDAQAWAKRVPGKGHAFGAKEAGEKAAKREKQAAKFDAAVDVKQRNTAFKKEDVIDEKESDYADKIAAFKKKGGKVEKQPEGPISKSLFRTTVGREKRRNPGKQATRDTFYDEVEVKELGPIGAFVARAAIKHVAKKAIKKATEDKEETVSEITKKYLDRAAVAANRKADQQRAVSKVAASRVGDTSQPPGQNIKSKRADFQAAKKDYQAFKFDRASKKKVDESNKLQADMALDDAGIKSYWEDGKLWVDKKDVLKAEKALSKSFKKGGEPHIYYKGGFLGVWNKKRKITG